MEMGDVVKIHRQHDSLSENIIFGEVQNPFSDWNAQTSQAHQITEHDALFPVIYFTGVFSVLLLILHCISEANYQTFTSLYIFER